MRKNAYQMGYITTLRVSQRNSDFSHASYATVSRRTKPSLKVNGDAKRYGRPGAAIARGVTPATNGEPETGARAPEALSIAYAKMSFEP